MNKRPLRRSFIFLPKFMCNTDHVAMRQKLRIGAVYI